jgi:O-antigen/teichoic acid export membrane protein
VGATSTTTLEASSPLPPTPLVPAKTAARSASLRWNFSWTFVGNVIYSACQWGMLVVLAKLGNPEMVGQYGLALAVATPILALSSLQLRAVLTTDVTERIPFGEYLGFRLTTTLISLLVIAGAPFVMHYRSESVVVIWIIGVAQAIEMLSDLYWARMQFNDHMDRIATSMIARGVLGLAALSAGVYLTRSVVWGAVGLLVARGLVLVGYDIRKRTQLAPSHRAPSHRAPSHRAPSHRAPSHSTGTSEDRAAHEASDALLPRWSRSAQLELLHTGITLGVIAMLVSLLPNLPRYFIAGSLGERALGIFTATAFLVSTGNLIILAMGQAAFVRLAKHYSAGEMARFNSLLLKLLAIGAVLGLAGIGVSALFGRLLLTLLYRPEYAEHADILVAMMVSGALGYIAALLGSAVTAARFFKAQIPVLAIAVGAAALSSWMLVHSRGLLGAAFAAIITSAVLCLGQAVVLFFALKHMRRPAVVAS